MRTLVVSDLHLGSIGRVDLLRRPELRRPLIERLADGIDRFVILGDCLELREGPIRAAAQHAEPLLREAGQALGPDGEIILAGGNHDHNLIGGWTEMHLAQDERIALEHRVEPHDAGPIPELLATYAAPARLTFTYPGIWLRDDVYALHGHYLDLHTTVPTIERLAAGTMARAVSPIPEHGAEPADYEAALAPLYAWMYALAQRSKDSVTRAGSRSSTRFWLALTGEGRKRRPVRAAALNAGLRAGVAVVNLAGIGPVEAKLSGPALRRGSLRGLGEVLRRLDVRAEYVLFGHTHRSGPWPHDDPAEWRAPTGARLVNTGSWVYQRHFLSDRAGEGPYWPGTAILVEDEGPPRIESFLRDRSHQALKPPPA